VIRRLLLPALALLLAACTGTPASQPAADAPTGASSTRSKPTSVSIGIGSEVNNFAAKFESLNTYASEYQWLVDSPLTVLDPKGMTHPFLAAELPSRDNGTWVVNPDGTMRTDWKIRSNAVWHDGQPVKASDFAVAFRVYKDDGVPVRDRDPERLMDRVVPMDDSTFSVYWKVSYPWANALAYRQLEPLPEHILGSIYEAGDGNAFVTNPFFTSTAYVGTGPYRLTDWEPGTQLTFRASDSFFLGRPKIDTVIFRVISDGNAVVANLLGGTIDVTVSQTMGPQSAATVREQWAQSKAGKVIAAPVRWRYVEVQHDPARNQQPALLDPRVRRALVHGIDRETLANVTAGGTSGLSNVPLVPEDPLFGDVDRAIAKYPFDPARATALLQEAGWTRRGDTFERDGQPFALEVRATQLPENEMELNIIAADLTKLGLQVASNIIPQARMRDFEYRVTFPGLSTTANSIDNPGALLLFTSEQCASAGRSFTGANRGCWKNAEFDRLYDVATTSLDPADRRSAVIQAFKMLTEEVGVFGTTTTAENIAIRDGLVGPTNRWPGQVGATFNIYEWEWK
jgi:peptide/nickel transport system substrate-binding protein